MNIRPSPRPSPVRRERENYPPISSVTSIGTCGTNNGKERIANRCSLAHPMGEGQGEGAPYFHD